jgi:hypothetical protein
MRLAPVFAASALAFGFAATIGLSTTSSSSPSYPTPVTVVMTHPTWGLPVPCPPRCTTIPTMAPSP